jgi:hypothetical protein
MARSARALVVELVADVGDFVKGTQKADDALSDFVRDADRDLDKVERSARDMADGIERALDDLTPSGRSPFDRMAADSKTATDKIERNFDNLAREAKTSFEKVGRAADDGMDDLGRQSSGRAGEFGAEAGAEFAQNMGEGISSGDFSGVATGTAGGLAASFSQMGPLGVVAGIGIGLAGVMFDGMLKESKKRAEQISNLVATQMAGVVEEFQATLAQTTAGQNLRDLLTELGEGDFGKGFDQMKTASNALGINLDQMLVKLQNGTLTTGDIEKAFRGTVEEAKKTGAAMAPIVQAQNNIKNAVSVQAAAARKVAVDSTVMKNAMDPAAADAAQMARNTGQMSDSMHGVSGDASSAAGSFRSAAGHTQGILTDFTDLHEVVANTKTEMDRLKISMENIDKDRNVANLASNLQKAATAAAQVRGAPGTVVGGKRLSN